MEQEKRLVRYTRRGSPVFEDKDGNRLCCMEGCYNVSYDKPLCNKHYKDGNDYSEYIESIKMPFNIYVLIDNSYYEMSVNNSDLKYKIDKENYDFAKNFNWHTEKNGRYTYLVAKNKGKRVKFHIEIMQDRIDEFKKLNNDYGKRVIIDHINGDVTDNRKYN